jgi:uncharacterized protein YdeI (YjbR/CyaY-like superfamily)
MSFATANEFEKWLAKHHADPAGIWLKIAKKSVDPGALDYQQALEVALCFGWIDGQKKGFDETAWLQRFTPRRARSRWSKINRDKVEALIAAGKMRPSGFAEVEAAKADGRWDAAYEGQSTATVPPDLQAALDANPAAAEFFKTLKGANRYAILYRINDAKRPATRQARVEKFIGMLERGETVYPLI